MSHHHRTPIDDLKHTINRDAALASLYLGSKLDQIAREQAEQTRLARLQWWNSLTPEQQQAELAKAEAERVRQEALKRTWARQREEQAMRKAGYDGYWLSRAGWFILLTVVSWGAAGIAWGPETKRPWIFVLYWALAVVAFFGPLKQRARRIRAERDRKYEAKYGTPVWNATGVTNSPRRPSRTNARATPPPKKVVNLADEPSVEKETRATLPQPSTKDASDEDTANGNRRKAPVSSNSHEGAVLDGVRLFSDPGPGGRHGNSYIRPGCDRINSIPKLPSERRDALDRLREAQDQWRTVGEDRRPALAVEAMRPFVTEIDIRDLSEKDIYDVTRFLCASQSNYGPMKRELIAEALSSRLAPKVRGLPSGLLPTFAVVGIWLASLPEGTPGLIEKPTSSETDPEPDGGDDAEDVVLASDHDASRDTPRHDHVLATMQSLTDVIEKADPDDVGDEMVAQVQDLLRQCEPMSGSQVREQAFRLTCALNSKLTEKARRMLEELAAMDGSATSPSMWTPTGSTTPGPPSVTGDTSSPGTTLAFGSRSATNGQHTEWCRCAACQARRES